MTNSTKTFYTPLRVLAGALAEAEDRPSVTADGAAFINPPFSWHGRADGNKIEEAK